MATSPLTNRISPREARRLRKHIAELEHVLEEQRRVYGSDWPGGTNIATASFANIPEQKSAIKTARWLGHAVVAVPSGDSILFYALPLPKVTP